jgi:hypothetical protein
MVGKEPMTFDPEAYLRKRLQERGMLFTWSDLVEFSELIESEVESMAKEKKSQNQDPDKQGYIEKPGRKKLKKKWQKRGKKK